MKYKAFISYSHKDEKTARRIHRQLEQWHIPRSLMGRQTQFGPVPRTLRPVFRDRVDFAGGVSLAEATRKALQDSQCLIVLCSHHSAKSEYVNAEIREFQSLPQGTHIIPLLLDNGAESTDTVYIPEALSEKSDVKGGLLRQANFPIAPDLRESGDGRRRAMEKLVAGIIGLTHDEVARRAAKFRQNRNALLAGLLTGAVIFATAFSAYALTSRNRAQVVMEQSAFAIGGLIQEVNGLSAGNMDAAKTDALRALCDLFDSLSQDPNRLGQTEQAICLCERARASHAAGDTYQALRMLQKQMEKLEHRVVLTDAPLYNDTVAYLFLVLQTHRIREASRLPTAEMVEWHHRYLGELNGLAAKRPDITDIYDVYDQLGWYFIERLEEEERFIPLLEIVNQAVETHGFRHEISPDSLETEQIIYNQLSFFRYGILTYQNDLHNDTAAAAMVEEALEVSSSISSESDTVTNVDLQDELVNLHIIAARVYSRTQETEKVTPHVKEALRWAHHLQDRKDLTPEYAQEIAEKIQYLGVVLEEEQL